LGLKSYQGSENDVLDRFYRALQNSSADYVVRVTSDCPLIDATLIDKVIQHTLDHDLDYCSNTLEPTYPDGQDVEVVKFSVLEKAWREATSVSEREHVTPYIWKNSSYKNGLLFRSDNFQEGFAYGHLRMTVDEPKDFDVVSKIISALGFDRGWRDYAEYLEKNSAIKALNNTIARNEGYNES
jgi:spore coat polysaccharide biosynthesis protein SpsF (cytidylyltransferase family)